MFGYSEAPRSRLGSRRLGGPIEFKTLWPALREDLHEVYLTGGPARHDAVRAAPGAGLEARSFSKVA